MKVEDNHYKYRIETKDSNGSVIDFVDIDTVEPLRCAYDVQDELNLETNEHIKRVEEIILNADSTEFWYVDEDRSTDTHLVCYFEEVQLMANANHPMVDTDRSLFEYGKINANEYQDTNFICTHVMPNGVSRIYMSIDKDQLLYQVFTNETIKEYIAQNPITIWYAIRYPVSIPRSMSKGHLLTLDGQTDVSISTNGKEVGLPLVKFNIGETEYNVDNKTLSIKNTTEGAQIRNIVLEGNTPINYARGNGVNTTEQVSNTRYDFAPFYDGQTTIQGTVEGGYVSAKLYGDTMVNIAKPYGESPLLTATNESTLCDDLLGMNEEGIKLADGEITEGRIYGDSIVNLIGTKRGGYDSNNNYVYTVGQVNQGVFMFPLSRKIVSGMTYTVYMNISQKDTGCVVGLLDGNTNSLLIQGEKGVNEGLSRVTFVATKDSTATPYLRVIFNINSSATKDSHLSAKIFAFEGDVEFDYNKHGEFFGIGSVTSPNTYITNENLVDPSLFRKGINIALTGGGVMVDGDTSVGWQSFYNNTTAIKLLANHTYKLRAFLLEGEYTGGNFKYSLSNNTAKEAPYTNTFTITPTTDAYLTALSFYAPKGIGAKFGISLIETSNDLDTYIPYKSSKITTTHTLNKLPNGVADYIDVVNKVHVQRVGVFVADGADTKSWSIGTFSNSSVNTECTIFSTNISDKLNNWNINHKICDKWSLYNTDITSNDIANIEGVHSGGNADSFFINVSNTKATTVEQWKTYLQSNPFTYLYELKTPIYTPLTDEEIAQLPLSAYADGYINLSSDQLMPSFEFRMRASNRYQVDMLETGYYYLNAPTGNVKLGTANVDVQQMPCIVKVDNVGTGDSAYRLRISNGFCEDVKLTVDGYYLNIYNGELLVNSSRATSDYVYIDYYGDLCVENLGDREYFDMVFYDEDKRYISYVSWDMVKNYGKFKAPQNAKYFRVSIVHKGNKVIRVFAPTTLAKLPSHRIPTSFTQGMKCGTNFGYWEGIIGASASVWNTEVENMSLSILNSYKLNRIEHGGTIVEDEFDVATGKFTKRVGKTLIDERHTNNVVAWSNNTGDYCTFYIYIDKTSVGVKNSKASSIILNNILPSNTGGYLGTVNGINRIHSSGYIPFSLHKDVLGVSNVNNTAEVKEAAKLFIKNHPVIIYYELEVPEVTYLTPPKNQLKTKNGSTYTFLGCHSGTLRAQVKPSHLTYPVPSLVGNRTYTVVHNRKNINGSTKPITLDLGGTQVELNDTSSKTLVKTPSSLKHSSLIFIGGESTVDHVMVLDGDWTNKPIEYFENMKGHDTDAIITIIGNGQINDVAEQYLW